MNDTLRTATDLGSFSGASNSRSQTGSVSMTDVNDVYKFRLNAATRSNFTSNLQIQLTQINNGNNDVDIELFRDINNNGAIDSGDLVINAFDQPQTGTKRLNLRGMDDETYFVRVRKDRGSDVGTGLSNYRLDINSQATQGREQESNNSLAQADVIEGNLNDTRRFEGSVNRSSDSVDFYKFKVDTPSNFFASIAPEGGSDKINFFVAKDFNNNGVLDGNDFSIGRNFFRNDGATIFSNENLEPGTYFLQVGASSRSSGTVDYDLAVGAFPLRRAELSVKVERLTALSNFEDGFDDGSGQADFRTTVRINNGTSSSRKIEERNDSFPNFDVIRSVNTSQRFVPFTISVKEEDRFRDDSVDIDPNSGSGLEFSYDTLTGRISGEGIVRQEGNLISLEGDRGDRARIQFRVNYRSFT